jgi:hypothetical protein
VRRIRVLVKANLDLRDALFAQRTAGELTWNGYNELLRPRGWCAEVRHETFARSDVLLQLPRQVPAELVGSGLDLDPFPADAQFRSRIFSDGFAAVVLSIQPDVTHRVWEHRREGYRFYVPPGSLSRWPEPRRQWLREECEPRDLLEPDASLANFSRVVERIRASFACPIVIANLSPWVADERLHSYRGVTASLSERIKRFNLGLLEVSRALDVSILDIERVLAEAGAKAHTDRLLRLDPAGCRLVAQELLRILEERGAFD